MQNLRRVSTSSVDSYTFCYHFALIPWIVQNYFIPLRCSFLVVPEAIQTIRCFFAHKRTHHTHPICKNLRSHNSISQLSTHCVDILWNDRLTHLGNSVTQSMVFILNTIALIDFLFKIFYLFVINNHIRCFFQQTNDTTQVFIVRFF